MATAAGRVRILARQLHSTPASNGGLAYQTVWAQHAVDPVPSDQLLQNRSLKGKTLFITGASRGIGLAIALRAARDGANIVIAAKTTEAHPKLEGTIYTAAAEVEAAGGRALAVQCDIRSEESVNAAVAAAVAKFGGIDILVNNASAINLSNTEDVDMKRYDLMHGINSRGTFMTTKACLPFLKKAENPHVLTMAPPLKNLSEKWFANHVAYTAAKFGMSLFVLGHAGEFRPFGIAVNALWPRTTIGTAAVRNLLGGSPLVQHSRTPAIMADAAYAIFTRASDKCTGNFFVDDEVLASEGVRDFSVYSVDPSIPQHMLAPDFFV